MRNRNIRIAFFAVAFIFLTAFHHYGRGIWVPMYQSVRGKKTVAGAIKIYGEAARKRFLPHFEQSGISYPPPKITLLAMKEEKILEVWASAGENRQFICQYIIRKASGSAGPKLREGDRQVPEGIYRIVGLNPNQQLPFVDEAGLSERI